MVCRWPARRCTKESFLLLCGLSCPMILFSAVSGFIADIVHPFRLFFRFGLLPGRKACSDLTFWKKACSKFTLKAKSNQFIDRKMTIHSLIRVGRDVPFHANDAQRELTAGFDIALKKGIMDRHSSRTAAVNNHSCRVYHPEHLGGNRRSRRHRTKKDFL